MEALGLGRAPAPLKANLWLVTARTLDESPNKDPADALSVVTPGQEKHALCTSFVPETIHETNV